MARKAAASEQQRLTPSQTDILGRMSSPTNRRNLPWSWRQHVLVRSVVTVLSAVAAGTVGTVAHRMGAVDNIPYGLVIALLIVLLSTWCARLRSGAIGVGVHLIVCSLTVWFIAGSSSGGDVLTPIGFGGSVPFFSEYAGYAWLFGVVVVSLAVLAAPRRWIYGGAA